MPFLLLLSSSALAPNLHPPATRRWIADPPSSEVHLGTISYYWSSAPPKLLTTAVTFLVMLWRPIDA